MSEPAGQEELQRTPLFDEHVAAAAKMVPFAGWAMPIQYPAGIVAEHRAVREGAGVFDLSHMGEFVFTGERAGAALDRLVSSDIAGLAVGHARYGLLCNERGTIVDDVIVYRAAAAEYLMVVNAANVEKDRRHVQAHLTSGVDFENRSARTALIAVQGPRAVALVVGLADSPIANLPSFGVARAQVAGVETIAARTGYTGEDGFELFAAAADAPALWRALCSAGAAPVGLGARDTLRLEARLSLYGNEIDESTGPSEAGLGWTCKLDKEFVGRDAVARQRADGPSRKLVGLAVDGGVARHGYEVVADGKVVGHVTSGTFGPSVGRNIALAYVPVALSRVGTEVGVRIRGRDVPATLVPTPFYRRAAAAPTAASGGIRAS